MRRPNEFVAELTAALSSVERHYAQLFEQAPNLATPGNLVFTGVEDDPDTLETLSRLGFSQPERGGGAGARLAPRAPQGGAQ